MKKLYFILFLYFYIPTSAFSLDGIKNNRFFDIQPGLNIFGLITDINQKDSYNQIKMRFDFGFGIDFSIQLHDIIFLDLELSYLRKGAQNTLLGFESLILLEYFNINNLFKLMVIKEKLLILLGFSHNFLISGLGKFTHPYFKIEDDFDRMNPYNFGIVLGLEYIFKSWPNGMHLKGSIRFEMGAINLIKDYRPILYSMITPVISFGVSF